MKIVGGFPSRKAGVAAAACDMGWKNSSLAITISFMILHGSLQLLTKGDLGQSYLYC